MEKEKIISVMKRYELKYHLNKVQLEYFMNEINKYMKVDKYGLTTIASLYFDTPDYRLINRSIEKPNFKEKLRLRSYGLANEKSPTFLEIKRKCDGIVYKRRISLLESEAEDLINNQENDNKEQISRELKAFLKNYPKIEAKYLIIYDRLAYYQENSDLRITIDINPRYRVDKLNLHSSMDGISLLEDGGAILEVKVQHSVPTWLAEILTKGKIYQTSFSKVGEAHKREKSQTSTKPIINNFAQTQLKGGIRYGFTI